MTFEEKKERLLKEIEIRQQARDLHDMHSRECKRYTESINDKLRVNSRNFRIALLSGEIKSDL